ncbi:MAG: cellulose-binding domain-containing protein [Clostridia bacterium]|nr:cellulose-binding domain-containing protein [Clostridia bacterium]
MKKLSVVLICLILTSLFFSIPVSAASTNGNMYLKVTSLSDLKDGDIVKITNSNGLGIEWYKSGYRPHIRLSTTPAEDYSTFKVKKFGTGLYGFYMSWAYDFADYYFTSDLSISDVDINRFDTANEAAYKFAVSINNGSAVISDTNSGLPRDLQAYPTSTQPFLRYGPNPPGSLASRIWEIKKLVPYTVTFAKTGDWGTSFNATFTIKNNGNSTIQNWQLEFDFPYTISSIYDAQYVSRSGDHYILKNAGWNANIAPGATVTFGISGNPGNVTSDPTGYVLSSN